MTHQNYYNNSRTKINTVLEGMMENSNSVMHTHKKRCFLFAHQAWLWCMIVLMLLYNCLFCLPVLCCILHIVFIKGVHPAATSTTRQMQLLCGSHLLYNHVMLFIEASQTSSPQKQNKPVMVDQLWFRWIIKTCFLGNSFHLFWQNQSFHLFFFL